MHLYINYFSKYFSGNQNAILFYLLARLIPAGRLTTTIQKKRKCSTSDDRTPETDKNDKSEKVNKRYGFLESDPYRNSYMLVIQVIIVMMFY